jgi:hypothetical protein
MSVTELEDSMRMRYRFVARSRRCLIALAVVGASLSVLANAASAETYHASNTEQFEEAVTKANANTGANTIVLTAGPYLPGATVTFTNTTGLLTIEGPAASIAVQGGAATLQGTNVEPFPSELFVVEPGASVAFKKVEIIHAGGAGVPAVVDLGKITVESSLVGGNTGQGISVKAGAELTATNSTFSSGQAFGLINAGTTSLFNATVAFNVGGGIENKGTLGLTNTIVAENKGAGDCKGAATTSDHSLDSNGSCGVSMSKVNPLLTKLINDGGSTKVHVPEPASPAIGAGNPATCTATDQRGGSPPTKNSREASTNPTLSRLIPAGTCGSPTRAPA